jgi:hypothetical protein
MARKFHRAETVPSSPAITTRLGAQGAPYKDTEIGKLVKVSGEGHVLCALGDQIDGQIVGVEAATSDGFGIGSVNRRDMIRVRAEGSQAAGTGNLVVGDQVVCGTAVAKDSVIGGGGVGMALPQVRKSTVQVGSGAPADLTAVGAQLALVASGNIWRVSSLLGGDGSPGTEVMIERVFNYG